MELTLPGLLVSVALIVGGYVVRYLQAKNNPLAPINPLAPAPVAPVDPKLGEGLILSMILKMLPEILKALSQQVPVQEAKAPEPVDVNELMRLLTKTLQTQPPQT